MSSSPFIGIYWRLFIIITQNRHIRKFDVEVNPITCGCEPNHLWFMWHESKIYAIFCHRMEMFLSNRGRENVSNNDYFELVAY